MGSPHPEIALFGTQTRPASAPCCDHYAGTEKLIGKSLELQGKLGPVFDLTVDLEDGAAIGNEKHHRNLAIETVLGVNNRFKRIGVRIHDPQSAWWQEDLRAVVSAAGSSLSHLTVPKISSLAEAKLVLALLEDTQTAGGVRSQIPVHFLIETFGALREIWEIAALPGVRGLDFGLMDFVSAHGGIIPDSAMSSPGQFSHALIVRAKSEICAAAIANGKLASHNVTPQYSDSQQTREDARVARRQFGFTRMWSIHPAQIPAIIEGMSPDLQEVSLAGEIVLAGWRAAWAPISYGSRLHDRASYRYYWSVLRTAHSNGLALAPEVIAAFFTKN